MSTLPVEEPASKLARRKRKSVGFAEKEEVINPEDVDSTVGRFRNMVSVEVIPNKVRCDCCVIESAIERRRWQKTKSCLCLSFFRFYVFDILHRSVAVVLYLFWPRNSKKLFWPRNRSCFGQGTGYTASVCGRSSVFVLAKEQEKGPSSF